MVDYVKLVVQLRLLIVLTILPLPVSVFVTLVQVDILRMLQTNVFHQRLLVKDLNQETEDGNFGIKTGVLGILLQVKILGVILFVTSQEHFHLRFVFPRFLILALSLKELILPLEHI